MFISSLETPKLGGRAIILVPLPDTLLEYYPIFKFEYHLSLKLYYYSARVSIRYQTLIYMNRHFVGGWKSHCRCLWRTSCCRSHATPRCYLRRRNVSLSQPFLYLFGLKISLQLL
jgi:hypothetical protein